MSNIFVCYKACSTCSTAEKYLKDNNIEYVRREITTETPTVEELTAWYKMSGLDLKSFFNTRGGSYRELNLKETYDSLTDEQRIKLLSEDGMLIKRPILVTDNKVVLGYKKESYSEIK